MKYIIFFICFLSCKPQSEKNVSDVLTDNYEKQKQDLVIIHQMIFVENNVHLCLKIGQIYNIPPSILLSFGLLYSENGQSNNYTKRNNVFNIGQTKKYENRTESFIDFFAKHQLKSICKQDVNCWIDNLVKDSDQKSKIKQIYDYHNLLKYDKYIE